MCDVGARNDTQSWPRQVVQTCFTMIKITEFAVGGLYAAGGIKQHLLRR